jgi:hypothetical protein
MPIALAKLVADEDWIPMPLDQQGNPSYYWEDGRVLADAPVDFAATFAENMWVTTKPIDLPAFNRNPLGRAGHAAQDVLARLRLGAPLSSVRPDALLPVRGRLLTPGAIHPRVTYR